jgi:phytoene dehydrogenase-like protein
MELAAAGDSHRELRLIARNLITLARAGLRVTVLEAAAEPGGGSRSAELTLPGFVHDVCSSIHVFGRISPFFADLQPALAAHGLRWIRPPAALGPRRRRLRSPARGDVDETARGLGVDGDAYRDLFGWLVDAAPTLLPDLLGPFHVPLSPPRALRMARFGLLGLQPATRVARHFRSDAARALFAGIAAHSILPLTEPVSAAAALVLGAAAHVDGWPFPEGGAGMLPRALVAELEALGGRVETGRRVANADELPPHRVALFDTSPAGLAGIAGDRLPAGYRRRLEGFRHGPGVFKLDIAIDGPIPWRAPELLDAATVHLGGTLEEIARGEAEVAAGRVPDRPFVLLTQTSLFDPSRAPAGRHTVWAYRHVPNGSGRRHGPDRRPGSSDSRRFPGPDPRLGGDRTGPARGRQRERRRRRHRRREARPAAAVHAAVARILDPYATPNPRSTCARHRRRPVAASTACRACSPPARRFDGWADIHRRRAMETIGVVLNVDSGKVDEFLAGLPGPRGPDLGRAGRAGTLLRASISRLDISSRPVAGSTQFLIVAVFATSEGHHEHDNHPGFEAWNKLADAFQVGEPLAFGGETVISRGD